MPLCIVNSRRDILHLQLTLVHCLVQPQKMRSIHASRTDGRDWYKVIVLQPPSHGLRWRELWVLQMTLLPNFCLTVGLLTVKRASASFAGGRVPGIIHGLCESWWTASCRESHFCTLCFANEEFCICACRRWDHLFSVSSADRMTAGKHPNKISCRVLPTKRSNHTQ